MAWVCCWRDGKSSLRSKADGTQRRSSTGVAAFTWASLIPKPVESAGCARGRGYRPVSNVLLSKQARGISLLNPPGVSSAANERSDERSWTGSAQAHGHSGHLRPGSSGGSGFLRRSRAVCQCTGGLAFEVPGVSRRNPQLRQTESAFSPMDPESVREFFHARVCSIDRQTAGDIVGMDGKESRRSFDRASGKCLLHTVSAWSTGKGSSCHSVRWKRMAMKSRQYQRSCRPWTSRVRS